MQTRRLALLAALPIALATACGGSSGGSPAASATPTAQGTAPADTAAATADVTKNWETFFNYQTPQDQLYPLLQGGQALAPAIKVAQKEQQKTHLKQIVKVKSVEFTSPTQATVHYALYNGKNALLPDSTGVAVYEDGTWKVSKVSFCTLIQLGNNGKPVPSC
jgi:hypothetical protein